MQHQRFIFEGKAHPVNMVLHFQLVSAEDAPTVLTFNLTMEPLDQELALCSPYESCFKKHTGYFSTVFVGDLECHTPDRQSQQLQI